MEATLSNRIAVFRSGCSRIEQQLDSERKTIVRFNGRIERIKEESEDLVKAVALLDKCIELVSANGIGKIESIVSGGLHSVFQDKTLGLVVEKKETARGYSYRILIRHGDTIGSPMESFGGGVQNVAAFLLRVILIKRFKLPKLLVVDESFNNISAEFIPNVSATLQTLAKDHGYTILAITHQPKLAENADHIYEVVPGKISPTLRILEYDSISEEGELGEANKAEVA
jgi:DNA repair exonuclease SbcCD ATPase subunit